ncbi:hypothetical protein ACE1SV_53800 [Streptomyces sp. E-15]
MTVLPWGALPCLAFALLVAGLVWRYRYDKDGWTTARRRCTSPGC